MRKRQREQEKDGEESEGMTVNSARGGVREGVHQQFEESDGTTT